MPRPLGRPTLFGRKDGGRVQGMLTKDGRQAFELARRAVQRVYNVGRPSDSEVIEWMARRVQFVPELRRLR